MYRLIEVSFINNEETQAYYPYQDIIALEADFETKLGQAMTSNTPELLIALDNIGKVVKGSNKTPLSTKFGTHDFAPRLYECKTKEDTEDVDLSKQETNTAVSARYHTKKGSAMKDKTVKQEVLYGFANTTQIEYCQWVRPIEQDQEQEEESTPESEEPTPEPEEVAE